MGQLWFPALILSACVLLNLTAMKAAGSDRPDHPLVDFHSPKSRKFFGVAAAAYAVSLGMTLATGEVFLALAAALAAVGLIFTAIGALGSKKQI